MYCASYISIVVAVYLVKYVPIQSTIGLGYSYLVIDRLIPLEVFLVSLLNAKNQDGYRQSVDFEAGDVTVNFFNPVYVCTASQFSMLMFAN